MIRYALLSSVLITIAVALQGCAVPLLTGLKEVRTKDGTTYSFITGADFRIGANGVDTVADTRSIKPQLTPKQ